MWFSKMCEDVKVDQFCRLCSVETEGTNIYGEEGVRKKLEAKIKSYLHIEVSYNS